MGLDTLNKADHSECWLSAAAAMWQGVNGCLFGSWHSSLG